MAYGSLQAEVKMEKKRVLKTIRGMPNIPEEMSYRERNRICRREEIWQERHPHRFEAIDTKEAPREKKKSEGSGGHSKMTILH